MRQFGDLLDILARDDPVASAHGYRAAVDLGLDMAAADRQQQAADIDVALLGGLLYGLGHAGLGQIDVEYLSLADAGGLVDAASGDRDTPHVVDLAHERDRLRRADLQCGNWWKSHSFLQMSKPVTGHKRVPAGSRPNFLFPGRARSSWQWPGR